MKIENNETSQVVGSAIRPVTNHTSHLIAFQGVSEMQMQVVIIPIKATHTIRPNIIFILAPCYVLRFSKTP